MPVRVYVIVCAFGALVLKTTCESGFDVDTWYAFSLQQEQQPQQQH